MSLLTLNSPVPSSLRIKCNILTMAHRRYISRFSFPLRSIPAIPTLFPSSSHTAFFLFLKNTKLPPVLGLLHPLSPQPAMLYVQISEWMDSSCYSYLSSYLTSKRPFFFFFWLCHSLQDLSSLTRD